MKPLHRAAAVVGCIVIALVGVAVDEPLRAWMHGVGRVIRGWLGLA
jgi:hypothetical protein